MITHLSNIAASSTELMTSQIRSCIKYLTPTDNILLRLLHSNLLENLSALTGF